MLLDKEVYLIQYFQIIFMTKQKSIINTTTKNDPSPIPGTIY